MTGGGLERRIVTILFCDLVDFTPLSERFDAEDVATIQEGYFESVRASVARYGGIVGKFIGDAAMAVFGTPRTRDDDAERAVRAAVSIVRAIDRVTADLDLDPGELQVRVGVNTGEVATNVEQTSAEMLVTGDTVNVAARLQSAAPVGRILVGEHTALAIAHAFELEEAGGLTLKGKSAPVRASVVIQPRANPSRDHAMSEMRAPMLGRDDELGHLRAAWTEAQGGGSIGLTLVAPPGVGKSRLLSAFLADEAAVVARCRPDSPALQPIADLLRSALGQRSIDDARRLIRDAHPSSVRAGVLADSLVDLLEPGRGPGLGLDQKARFDTWISLLDLFAPPPHLWVIEDLHRASDDVLAFLRHALRGPGPRAILCAARPSLIERASAADLTELTTILEVPTLPADIAGDLLEALVGRALPDHVVLEVARRSDGTPLFIEELVRTWVSVGVLVRTDDGWQLTVEPEQIPLPHTVQAIYAAQLDDLPAAARETVRRGSVSGRRMPADALASLGVSDPTQGIAVLTRRGIVSGPMRAEIIGDTYLFRHALVRDAGYASLARRERAELHIRLAQWIEEAAGDTSDPVAEIIAAHHDEAVRSMPALSKRVGDLDSEELVRRTAAWLERAGTVATSSGAVAAAIKHSQRALELTPPDAPIDRARRLHALGSAMATGGDTLGATPHLEEAWGLVRSTQDPAKRLRVFRPVAHTLFTAYMQSLEFAKARDFAAEALELCPDEDALTAAYLQVLWASAESGLTNAPAGLKEAAARLLDLAREHGDEDLEFHGLRITTEDEDGLLRLAELAAASDDPAAQFQPLVEVAYKRVEDRVDTWRATLSRAREVAEAFGEVEGTGWADYHRAELEMIEGRWSDAIDCARAALDLSATHGMRRLGWRTIQVLTALAAERADRDSLRMVAGWLAENRTSLPGRPSPYGAAGTATADLTIELMLGSTSPATDLAVLRAAARLDSGLPSWAHSCEVCVATLTNRGSLDDAVDQCARLPRKSQLRPRSAIRPLASLLPARVALARGEDVDAVETGFRAGLAEARAIGAAWLVARSIRFLHTIDRASRAEVAELSEIEGDLGLSREWHALLWAK